MYQPLPAFPPLFPPGEWWRIYVGYRLRDFESRDAINEANRESGLRSRDWMRFKAAPDITLSLPVAGGASALKNRNPGNWTIAHEAKRDWKKILHTLDTIYGRLPFYHLLKEEIFGEIELENISEASEICQSAFRGMERVLGLLDCELICRLKQLSQDKDDRFRQICKQFAVYYMPEISLLDSIFRIGPDAIFILSPAF